MYIGQARNVELFGIALQPYSRTRNYRTGWGKKELQYTTYTQKYIGQARNVELFGTALQPCSRTRNYRTGWGNIELYSILYTIHYTVYSIQAGA